MGDKVYRGHLTALEAARLARQERERKMLHQHQRDTALEAAVRASSAALAAAHHRTGTCFVPGDERAEP